MAGSDECKEIRIDCMKQFDRLDGTQGIINNEIQHIKSDVIETKMDVKEIKEIVVNHKIKQATTKIQVDAWAMFFRVSWVTILTALIGGIVSKFLKMW